MFDKSTIFHLPVLVNLKRAKKNFCRNFCIHLKLLQNLRKKIYKECKLRMFSEKLKQMRIKVFTGIFFATFRFMFSLQNFFLLSSFQIYLNWISCKKLHVVVAVVRAYNLRSSAILVSFSCSTRCSN